MEKEIHAVQIGILKVLLFTPEARFSDLNSEKVSTDHFNFHVQRLLELEYIQKNENGLYSLTTKGKEFANRLDTDSKKVAIERQAKVAVLIGCIKGEGENKKYLIQQRLKQPFYGYYGFVTGKVKWGETIIETAVRELEEETGLSATLSLSGIEHKMDYDKGGNLLEDKYFFVVKATDPKGELMVTFEGGRNVWMTKKEFLALPELFDDVKDALRILDEKNLAFEEFKFKVKRY